MTSSLSPRLRRVGGRSSGETRARPGPDRFVIRPGPGVATRAVGDDRRALGREHERSAHEVGVAGDPVARPELAGDEGPRERVLDEALDRPLERPGPERGIRPLADDERRRGRRELEREVLPAEPARQVGQQQLHVDDEVLLGQRVEDDDLVDAVEELGPELAA